MTEHTPTRRTVILGLCGAVAAGLGSALLAEGAHAATGVVVNSKGQALVTVKKVAALAKVGGIVNLGSVKGVPTAVVRTGPSAYAAIDLRCTHEGITVLNMGGSWSCPAHGSAFAANGAVTRGPALANLATVKSVLKKGVLTIG